MTKYSYFELYINHVTEAGNFNGNPTPFFLMERLEILLIKKPNEIHHGPWPWDKALSKSQ